MCWSMAVDIGRSIEISSSAVIGSSVWRYPPAQISASAQPDQLHVQPRFYSTSFNIIISGHLKKRPIIALPKLPAKPPVLNILVVKLDAWLNLSHLEKANVFVIVRTSAIPVRTSAPSPPTHSHRAYKLTNQTQPDKLQPHQSQNRQPNPKRRLRIQREPEEPAIRRVDDPRLRLS